MTAEERQTLLQKFLKKAASAGVRLATVPVLGYADMEPFKKARFQSTRRVLHAYLTLWSAEHADLPSGASTIDVPGYFLRFEELNANAMGLRLVMNLIEALEISRKPVAQDAKLMRVFLACGFTPLHLQNFLSAHLRQLFPENRIEIKTGLFGDLAGSLERLDAQRSRRIGSCPGVVRP